MHNHNSPVKHRYSTNGKEHIIKRMYWLSQFVVVLQKVWISSCIVAQGVNKYYLTKGKTWWVEQQRWHEHWLFNFHGVLKLYKKRKVNKQNKAMTIFLWFNILVSFCNCHGVVHLTNILQGHARNEVTDNQGITYRWVGHNHFISSKPELNNCFIKNSRINNSSMLILFPSKTAFVGHLFSETQKWKWANKNARNNLEI